MIALDAIHRDRHTEEIIGMTYKITGEDANRPSEELRTEVRTLIEDERAHLRIPKLPEYSGWVEPNYIEGGISYLLMSYTVEGF